MSRNLTHFCLLILISLLPGMAESADNVKILRRGNGVEPESLDPHRARAVETLNIMRDLYEGLTRHAVDGSIVPGVAQSWNLSDNGKRYTFTMRDEARWSNGEPVTAGDFVFALRRAINPTTASPYAKVLDIIENAKSILAGEAKPESLGVRVSESGQLIIRLDSPAAHLLQVLALPIAFPVHENTMARVGSRFARPEHSVTNGAYQLEAWQVHGYIRLKKNPHYWNHDEVPIDTVLYYPVADENAELSRFRAGELDLTFTLPARRVAWARDNLAQALHLTPYLGTYFYGFNLTRPPFKDQPGLRRALSLAIDRKVLTEKVLNTGDVPAWSWVPPGISGYQSARLEYADWDLTKKLAEAQKLYTAAGYSPDNPLQLELRFNTGDNHRRIALAIAAMWRQKLGIETTLINEEWKVFIQNRRQQQITQVYRSSWIGDYNDPWTFAEVMHSKHGINDFGYNSNDYNNLLKIAAMQTDSTKRNSILQRAEAKMLNEHPVIPLFFYVSKHLVSPRVGGWVDNPLDVHLSQYLYLKD